MDDNSTHVLILASRQPVGGFWDAESLPKSLDLSDSGVS